MFTYHRLAGVSRRFAPVTGPEPTYGGLKTWGRHSRGLRVTRPDRILANRAAADLVTGAEQAGLDVLALVGSMADGAAAEAAGACAVVYEAGFERSEGADGSADKGDATVRVESWEGDEEGLHELREQGAGALLLRDACDGSVYYGTDRCAALIRLSQSKQSLVYGGSMFGTVGDNAPPEQRNPRMWAQSKRQSREIMHESAKSRGLPPPKLKK